MAQMATTTRLRIATIAAALVLASPLVAFGPASAATTGFTAAFTPTAANAWWVQAQVTANAPLAGVDARVNGGSWQVLKQGSYGWAASVSAPSGSIVQFQARSTGGTTSLSGCYQWTTRAPIPCPASSSSTGLSATFTPTAANAWWVQAKVTANAALASVDARVNGGSWHALALQSYGWSASMSAPSGSIVQFQAKSTSGVTALSGCYQWTTMAATGCTAGSASPAPAPAPAPAPSPAPSSSSPSGLLWKDSFGSSPWQAPWAIKSSWGQQNFVATRESGGQFPTFMRVTYPAGSASPAVGGPTGGGEFKATMGMTPRDSLNMRYDVRFPVGFDFVRGGKLPGLYGGTGNSGGHIPDGTDGWSTRMMWRTGGAGEMYAYLPTSTTWGTSLGGGSWKFTADGKWHSVEQQVILNTPGSSNGEVRVWYDGVEVVHKTGLKFRTISTLKVNGIFFSTFFGGNDASWATPKTVHADFANFAVGTGRLGP